MTLADRKKSLISLGQLLEDTNADFLSSIIANAEAQNPWFTRDNILLALKSIRSEYLDEYALNDLISKYNLDDNIEPRNIGLILAGNIPLVGFHDVLCCYLAGHVSMIKYSDKDTVLMQGMVSMLKNIDPNSDKYFVEVEKLIAYDAAIATGSNATAKHFEYYFRHVPHIIRQNRNSIAVLSGDESADDFNALGSDIFSYFGMGCRNVSKVFVPSQMDLSNLIEGLSAYKDLLNHNKYKNNYDYNVALNLINLEPFLQGEHIILKESAQIISRIGTLHYQYYEKLDDVSNWIQNHTNEIQCVVSNINIPNVEVLPFGAAQCPSLDTYADGVDTMQFLLGL
ncbi:MAG: acyl-CoA reductase [Saprospiraceae bacterium]